MYFTSKIMNNFNLRWHYVQCSSNCDGHGNSELSAWNKCVIETLKLKLRTNVEQRNACRN